MTEAAGIPLGVVVAGANRHDMKLMRDTLNSVPERIAGYRQTTLVYWQAAGYTQGLCMDAGYDSDEVRRVAVEFGYTTHIRGRGQEKQACQAGYKARRWVVERTHSWLNRYRRLLVRWEKQAVNYLALLHFACALMTWNKCLFG